MSQSQDLNYIKMQVKLFDILEYFSSLYMDFRIKTKGYLFDIPHAKLGEGHDNGFLHFCSK